VSAAGLDALDRGVIEAGLMAAEALARVAALEATVAQLAKHVEQAATAEAIIRRAGIGAPPGPPRRAPRPRHLKAVPQTGGQQ
jgi:hypothetical protein